MYLIYYCREFQFMFSFLAEGPQMKLVQDVAVALSALFPNTNFLNIHTIYIASHWAVSPLQMPLPHSTVSLPTSAPHSSGPLGETLHLSPAPPLPATLSLLPLGHESLPLHSQWVWGNLNLNLPTKYKNILRHELGPANSAFSDMKCACRLMITSKLCLNLF